MLELQNKIVYAGYIRKRLQTIWTSPDYLNIIMNIDGSGTYLYVQR